MELHHKKHHQTYVNALNAAEASYAQSTTPKQRIALQAALKFNGGGKSCDRVAGVILSLVIDRDLTSSISLTQDTSTTLSSGRISRLPPARARVTVVP